MSKINSNPSKWARWSPDSETDFNEEPSTTVDNVSNLNNSGALTNTSNTVKVDTNECDKDSSVRDSNVDSVVFVNNVSFNGGTVDSTVSGYNDSINGDNEDSEWDLDGELKTLDLISPEKYFFSPGLEVLLQDGYKMKHNKFENPKTNFNGLYVVGFRVIRNRGCKNSCTSKCLL